jgi:bla regulator protein blaR1
MSGDRMMTLLALAAQHLWQSALLLAFAAWVARSAGLRAEARSWLVLAAFGLAALLPLTVLLPGDALPASHAPALPAPPAAAVPATVADGSQRASAASAPAGIVAMLPDGLAGAALAIWLAGSLWGLSRLALGWHQALRLRAGARCASELRRTMAGELPGRASIAYSDAVGGPMVVGLWRPCILLPPSLASAMAPAALVDLLRHEIAHIDRRDLWVAVAQRLLQSLYWWSPFLARIGANLDLVREMACDERAAMRSADGHGYAGSLLAGVEALSRFRQPSALLAVSMSGDRSMLARRVDALLAMDAAAPLRHAAGALRLMLCVIALAAGTSAAIAASPRLGTPAVADPRQAASAQARRLLDAAESGRLQEIRRLLAAGVDVNAGVSGEGTALIRAARAGQRETVDALLALGAQADLPMPGDGTPLIAAAAGGHRQVLERLIAAGAEIDRVVPYDETALISAARAGQLATVQALVEHGADVNLGVLADGDRWRTPFNQARNPRVRDYLVRHGAVPARR